MRIIHVLRKPLSEGTVAANTLRHGCGGLNIDASRITSHGDRANESGGGAGAGQYDDGVRSRTEERTYGGTLGGRVADPHPGGRWPANVILQHLDGCRCDGVKRVKPSNGSGTAVRHRGVKDSNLYGDGIGSLPVGTPDLGYTDEDGQETVANWICEPGCPVAALDEQSGDRPVSGAARNGRPSEADNLGWIGPKGLRRGNGALHNDTGGASRFYKQVKAAKRTEP